VELVCPRAPAGANRSLWQQASDRGVEPVAEVAAGRSAWRWGDTARIRQLRAWLSTDTIGGPFDVVHCWHGRDHWLAARALHDRGRSPASRLVRSYPRAERIGRWPWHRWLYGPGCDGLLCVSEASVAANRALRGPRAILACPGAVEPRHLRVRRTSAQVREELGVAAEVPLIGIVARLQRHRRFDLLFEAFAELLRLGVDSRLVVLGRGSHAESVAYEPVRRLSIADRVVFAGHRGEDYADIVSAMDLFTFLVPGSDGTCRALLEAAMLGRPLVASRRGAISEIVRDGETGLLVEEQPAALAGAWSELIRDPARRLALGRAAARDARERFVPERLAARVEAFYESIASRPVGATPAQPSSAAAWRPARPRHRGARLTGRG